MKPTSEITRIVFKFKWLKVFFIFYFPQSSSLLFLFSFLSVKKRSHFIYDRKINIDGEGETKNVYFSFD